MKKLTILSLATAFTLTAASSAQSNRTDNTLRLDDPTHQMRVELSELDWLAGSWRGTGMGGDVQELWAPAEAGTLLGLFKMSQGGESTFYEILLITQDDGGTVLRLKHFNADITAWEEKDDFVAFPLVKMGENAAYFSGLTYRLAGPDRLDVFLAMRRQDGDHEVEFNFHRMAD